MEDLEFEAMVVYFDGVTQMKIKALVYLFINLIPYVLPTCSKEKMANMTYILDKMLDGYDRRLRPGMGGSPVEVMADIYVRSMGAISEQEMSYSMDCYFRQKWRDARLSMQIPLENISLSIKVLERIWYPDTIFFNDHDSYVHAITTQNKFIRIHRDGSILFSQRLTINAACKMQLKKFPLDTQQCPLYFGSFGYNTGDVVYSWKTSPAVQLDSQMLLSQFDLVAMPAFNGTYWQRGAHRSILSVKFVLKRHTGFFLIQAYLPCALLVVLSWVSFWINREATADRIALGTTTILTMAFLGIDLREDFPKISYATALDLYVATCFLFILSTIVQFAVVHYHTKLYKGDIPSTDQSDSGDESTDESNHCDERVDNTILDQPIKENQPYLNGGHKSGFQIKRHIKKSSIRNRGMFTSSLKETRKSMAHGNSVCGDELEETKYSLTCNHEDYGETFLVQHNSVSRLDKVSRILFPLMFVVFNIAYWIAYLDM